MNNVIKSVLIATGVITTVTAAAFDNRNTFTVMAALGGGAAGAALATNTKSEAVRKREEATRVASAFRVLYEKNKGAVIPEEVSFHGEVDRDRAIAFLDALAQTQNGAVVPVGNTTMYSFPHTDNVLDTLTKNSQAWVDARTQPLLEENQGLKQQVAYMQQQMTAMQNQINIMSSMNTAGSTAPQNKVYEPTVASGETAQDPWKLL